MNNMKEKLQRLYEEWVKQVDRKFQGPDYSNPHYVGIPDGWETATQRIMIVGEEGYGKWGLGKAYGKTENDPSLKFNDFGSIQEYILDGGEKYPKEKNTKFWKRFRAVKELGFPCVWNNLDKIYRINKHTGALKTSDEILLHSTEIKILQKEIEILKPTTVIFFGWHRKSLHNEWPELYDELYKHENETEWRISKRFSIQKDFTQYIFTYHPGRTSTEYENQIMDYINSKVVNI